VSDVYCLIIIISLQHIGMTSMN